MTVDSPCDIGQELKQRYGVEFIPCHIVLDGVDYLDGINIDVDMIYKAWVNNKLLPKTAGITTVEYHNAFKHYTDLGFSVVHVCLGSALSGSYQNACLAASELDDVYVIDSKSLSTGFGLMVVEAAERIQQGMEAKQVHAEVQPLTDKINASFILDTLDFLHAGGRCSAIANLGANLMSIKPAIKVQASMCGTMTVGKKYVGKFDKCVLKYIEQQLMDRDDISLDKIFITYGGFEDESILAEAKEKVLSMHQFKEVFITRTGCTISSHCGPNTLGIMFMSK